jgi:ATP-dependent Clp protease ATP-binding subunit ClpA
LADAKVFRPEILGRIDRIYVFKALVGAVIAEIALLKIRKLAEEFKLKIDFVAPELILQALIANSKISRFGIRELERILFDMFAPRFSEAKKRDCQSVTLALDEKTKRLTVAVAPPEKKKLPKK